MNNDELRNLLESAGGGDEQSFNIFFKIWYLKYKSRCINQPVFKAAFMEAMFKIWEKFVLKENPLPEKLSNYFSIIIENTWKNHQKKGGKNKPVSLEDEIFEFINAEEHKNEEHNLIIKKENQETEDYIQKKKYWALTISFTKLSECCKEILTALYYENKKLKNLEGICGLKNYTTLKSKASQCRKKWEKLAKDLLDE